MTQYSISGSLPVTPPFDFAQSLHFLAHFPPMYGEQDITATSLTKAIAVNGDCVVFRLHGGGTVEQPEVCYTLFSTQALSSATVQAVIERIAFFLSLGDDLTSFYAIGRQDPDFAPIITQLYGLHHVKFLTLCEAACWSILAQRQPIPVARKMKRALTEAYGCSVDADGKTFWAFPEREQLTNVSVDELAHLINNERRATYLHNVIQGLEDFGEQFLRTAPYDEAEAALRSIKGIGAWSAAFILMRGLGRMERMLLDLKPFLEALPEVYGPDATMEELAQRYGPWFGYWGFYFRVAT